MTAPVDAKLPLERKREQRMVRDAYGAALATLLLSILLLIASGSPVVSPVALLASILVFAALVLTFRVSGVSRKGFAIGVIAISAAAVLSVATVQVTDFGRIVVLGAWMLFTTAAMGAIASRLRTYRHVTAQLVLGLLCIYLLVGLLFGLSYSLVDAVQGSGLDPADAGISGALYFSFITLATVGYGDFTPANEVVRAMAVAEAILGQLYLVSVVSLAVSRLRFGKLDSADGEDAQ